MGEISSFIECVSAEIGVIYCEQKTCRPEGHPIIVFNKDRASEFSLGFEAMESIESFSKVVAFFVAENSIDRDIAKGFTF
jgi:hypothetical protein